MVMTIEIKTPELEALIEERLQSGAFHDIDELLTKALVALQEYPGSTAKKPKKNFAQFLLESPLPGSGLRIERRKDCPLPAKL